MAEVAMLAGLLLVLGSLDPESKAWRRRLLLLLLVIGSVTPLVEWRRHAGSIWLQKSIRFEIAASAARSLPEVHGTTYEPAGIPFLRQYTGSPDAPFFRYLAAAAYSRVNGLISRLVW